jgi:hypothetical protein
MNPVIDQYGSKYWYNDELDLHREDGPAIEFVNGSKFWYIDGKQHRLDGPAVENANGANYWCIDGKLHRLDGPAIERYNGNNEWYIDNKPIYCHSNDEFLRIVKMKVVL